MPRQLLYGSPDDTQPWEISVTGAEPGANSQASLHKSGEVSQRDRTLNCTSVSPEASVLSNHSLRPWWVRTLMCWRRNDGLRMAMPARMQQGHQQSRKPGNKSRSGNAEASLIVVYRIPFGDVTDHDTDCPRSSLWTGIPNPAQSGPWAAARTPVLQSRKPVWRVSAIIISWPNIKEIRHLAPCAENAVARHREPDFTDQCLAAWLKGSHTRARVGVYGGVRIWCARRTGRRQGVEVPRNEGLTEPRFSASRAPAPARGQAKRR